MIRSSKRRVKTLDGKIDDVHVYDRALTDKEVRQIYQEVYWLVFEIMGFGNYFQGPFLNRSLQS